jgi:putative ABC transport system permease protein
MWLIAFRDLQMRRRRFIVAVLAVGLVFGITLLLDGFNQSLSNEVRRTIAAFNADSWLVANGSSGPFTADHLVAQDAVASLRRPGSAGAVSGLLALTTTIKKSSGEQIDVNIVGVSQPVRLSAGRWPASDHELVANDDLGIGIGKSVTLSAKKFTVVGHTAHLRYFVGTNAVFMRLINTQKLFVFGQRVVTAFVVQGALAGPLPKGLATMTNADVTESLRRPVKVAASTIAYLDILLWIVAAGIIGTILYMTSLERLRDFAALKAIGARSSQVVLGIGAQAVALSFASAMVAWLVSKALAPVFPIIVEIPFRSYPLTLAVALAVGLLGSIAGVRRAMAIDPALAFGG